MTRTVTLVSDEPGFRIELHVSVNPEASPELSPLFQSASEHAPTLAAEVLPNVARLIAPSLETARTAVQQAFVRRSFEFSKEDHEFRKLKHRLVMEHYEKEKQAAHGMPLDRGKKRVPLKPTRRKGD